MSSFRMTAIAAALIAAHGIAGAQAPAPDPVPPKSAAEVERESLEQLRQTTLALIELLVEQGVLTRERADALLRTAKERAAAAKAPAPPRSDVVRVPFVPDSVRADIREELRQEILAQARAERWGDAGALPAWLDRLSIDGDVRLRYQFDDPAPSNTLATQFAEAASDNGLTRAPALAARSSNGIASANTTEERERLRVRARLGVLARVDPSWGAALRLSTGATGSGVVNANQTLGQNGTQYNVTLDRAYVRYEPSAWLTASAGRIPNPFFGSNLVWNDDLGLEGVGITGRWARSELFQPFLTGGYFVLRESQLPARSRREFAGVQTGLSARLGAQWGVRAAYGVYRFPGLEGRVEEDFAESTSLGYGRYEYPAALRQQGNTVFRTNSITDLSTSTIWGLASKFRVENLTTALEWRRFDPVHVVVAGDYARNTAFDRGEIRQRTGINLPDGSNTGYQVRTTVGYPSPRRQGDWQFFLGYRRLGGDAVLDAFNDTDFGLGGTNHKGYFFGGTYGIGASSLLSLRYLASESLDTPTLRLAPDGSLARDSYKVDVLQLDLNVRF